jgi:hypothetical protein
MFVYAIEEDYLEGISSRLFSTPELAEESIIDVLKYSQRVVELKLDDPTHYRVV